MATYTPGVALATRTPLTRSTVIGRALAPVSKRSAVLWMRAEGRSRLATVPRTLDVSCRRPARATVRFPEGTQLRLVALSSLPAILCH